MFADYFDESDLSDQTKLLQEHVSYFLSVLLSRNNKGLDTNSAREFAKSWYMWLTNKSEGNTDEEKQSIVAEWYAKYVQEIDDLLLVNQTHDA
jgi:hypothetical protein